MRRTILATLATAAIGSASLVAAPAPVEARSVAFAEAVAKAQAHESRATEVQYRRYYGNPRYYAGRPYYGRYYRRDRGAAAAGIAGLAAGALIGGAIASQQAQAAPTYVVPGRSAAYCAQRYRSYDPASGTFLGYDGRRHPCP